MLALAALFSLYRLSTLFRVISPLSLWVALTGAKSGSKKAFASYKKALKLFMDSLPEEAKVERQ